MHRNVCYFYACAEGSCQVQQGTYKPIHLDILFYKEHTKMHKCSGANTDFVDVSIMRGQRVQASAFNCTVMRRSSKSSCETSFKSSWPHMTYVKYFILRTFENVNIAAPVRFKVWTVRWSRLSWPQTMLNSSLPFSYSLLGQGKGTRTRCDVPLENGKQQGANQHQMQVRGLLKQVQYLVSFPAGLLEAEILHWTG